MLIEYRFFETSDKIAYEKFIANCDHALFYHSLKYKVFLEKILKDSQSQYLLAVEKDTIVAAIPMFVLKTELGSVVNSLPFFGSHGSVIALPNTQLEIKRKLIERFTEYCKSLNVLSATIVSNLETSDENLLNEINPDYVTFRTGQVTMLPKADSSVDLEKKIMSCFHPKTRHAIRKGFKSGLIFQVDNHPNVLSDTFDLHYDNLKLLNGLNKPREMFELIDVCFNRSEDYEIFTARTPSGLLVSSLLVFYFKDWTEYFVPTTKEEFRHMQPLSALIYFAMKHSIVRKSSYRWNWGGTWPSQTNVYFFKSRWGSIDYQYKYFTKEFSEISVKKQFSKETLIKFFRYFYIIPFSEL